MSNEWLLENMLPVYRPEFRSPFADISTLACAHRLVITAAGSVTSRYWQLEPQDLSGYRTEQDYLNELQRLFKQAVERRLDSAFPLSVELSEGLDSCGITGYAARALGDTPLFSMSFSGTALTADNQHIWAGTYQDIHDMLAMHRNVQPLWGDEAALRQATMAVPSTALCFGGPVNDGNFYAERCCLAQQQGCRTVLSGWGGDHCVSSYGDEYEWELFYAGRLGALTTLIKQKHQRGRGTKPYRRLLQMLFSFLMPKRHQQRLNSKKGLVGLLYQRFECGLVNPVFIKAYRLDAARMYDNYEKRTVQQRDYRELCQVGVMNRIAITEIAARRNRLQYRYPMLDKQLVEFAYSVPAELKIKYGIERYMFRQILQGYTTERIRLRRKADVEYPAVALSDKINDGHADILTQPPAWLRPMLSPQLDTAVSKFKTNFSHTLKKDLALLAAVQQAEQQGELIINP